MEHNRALSAADESEMQGGVPVVLHGSTVADLRALLAQGGERVGDAVVGAGPDKDSNGWTVVLR